jgi:hypothetical protein
MKKISLQLGERYSYYTISVSELQNLQTQFSINRRRQRKYLFNDIPGKKGHSWQRDIFLSLVLGNPLPQFELTDLGNGKYLIEDGQQRTYTILAILTDCVRLPKEIESFGPEYLGLANKCFSELPPEIIKQILGTELILLVSTDVNEEELHNRFVLINNGTPLSAQDKRSAQYTDGATYIQSLVDGVDGTNSTKYKMFYISSVDDKIQHTYIDVSPLARSVEEIVAHWFNTHLADGKTKEFTQPTLNQMYDKFWKDDRWKTKISRFETYLKALNTAITQHNKRKDIKGRIFTYSFYVLKTLLDRNINVELSTFIEKYITAYAKLKHENKIYKDKKKGVNYTMQDLLRTAAKDHHMKYVIDSITNQIIKDNQLIEVDSKRTFSKEEKRIKYQEQTGKCGYCEKDITLDEGVCDHKIPHSAGGRTEIDNLVVACKYCNSFKSGLPFEAWEAARASMNKVIEA